VRLLEITNDFPPVLGGIENYVYSLVSRWPDDVVVLTRWSKGADSFDRNLDFEVRREPVGTLLPTPHLLTRASLIIKERSIDAVHFASPLPLALMGQRLLRRNNVPYSVSVHGGEFVLPSRLPVGRQLLRSALEKAALLLPVSSFTQAAVKDFFGDQPACEVITPGVDPDRFGPGTEPAEIDAVGSVIVSVSRLVARKGPATLIRALEQIVRPHPSAHLVIVGGGPDLSRLRRLASKLRVERSVTFAGPQPWADMPHYYAAGDIFALPTRARFGGLETEGFPLVFLEAAASSLPAVAGDAGGIRDAVVDGETGYMVDGRSPEETATAILRLLDNPDGARAMGEAARRRAVEEFDWDRIANRFHAALAKYLS
jgi:phosphatidylinositol alpha-1,6-mannosyltransferase